MPEGLARHHIDDGELKHAMSREDAIAYVMALPPAVANSAHDVKVVLSVLPEFANEKWVCTYKCGLELVPDAEQHTAQFLRYHMQLPVDRSLASPACRAAPEAYVGAHIFVKLLQDMELRALLKISATIAPRPEAVVEATWVETEPSYDFPGEPAPMPEFHENAELHANAGSKHTSPSAPPAPSPAATTPAAVPENPNWQREFAEAVLKSPVTHAVIFS
jgi:hypothetical protein